MKLDILAFAAHPDDVELAASGTVLKHISMGYSVGIIDMTQGELGSRGTKKTRKEEAKLASEIMGISVRENLAMADGFFENSQENKRLIIEQIRRFQPKIVLANAVSDRHPDHSRASKLVSEACFLAGLPKIQTYWNAEYQIEHRPEAVYHYIQDYYQKPDFVVDVSDFKDKKMEAISAFKTQFFNPDLDEPKTPISGQDFLESIVARMREMGRPAGYEFAEGFNVERFLGVPDLMKVD